MKHLGPTVGTLQTPTSVVEFLFALFLSRVGRGTTPFYDIIIIIIIIIIVFIDLYCANINPGKEIFICPLH